MRFGSQLMFSGGYIISTEIACGLFLFFYIDRGKDVRI